MVTHAWEVTRTKSEQFFRDSVSGSLVLREDGRGLMPSGRSSVALGWVKNHGSNGVEEIKRECHSLFIHWEHGLHPFP